MVNNTNSHRAGLIAGLNALAYTIAHPIDTILILAESRTAREVTGFPILSAKIEQISGGYMPDIWDMLVLRKGGIVYGGFPGQSAFYTDEASVLASKGNPQLLGESLQVRAHPVRGYRDNIGQYVILKDTRVPVGIVHSNLDLGAGGGQQLFIKFYLNILNLTNEYSLEEFYANQMSRNYLRH